MSLTLQTINGNIAIAALNRPDAANALNTQMALDLKAFFTSATKYRAIILTGNGKTFCAGADLKERKGMNESQWQAQHHTFEEALHALMNCEIPVIAAVNGSAFGGGLELALACDFIYAADTARFAFTEVTLGIMPGLGGTQTLPRAIGMAHAKELILTGKPFSAEEAFQWGMVNKLCSAAALQNDSLACATSIAANAPLSVKAAKAASNQGATLPIAEALQCELKHYNTLLTSRDRHEGINAFNEKRKAVFTGE